MQENPIIVLTREREDNEALIERLQGVAAEIVEYPCIETEILYYKGEPVGGRALEDFDALAFSSKRGVKGMGLVADRVKMGKFILATVGEKTAEEIERLFDRTAHIIAEPQSGEGMARALIARLPKKSSILHIRGNKTTGAFETAVKEAGLELSELIVYVNREPKLEPINLKGGSPIIFFASPSAAKAFYAVNQSVKGNEKGVVAIGETTAEYLKKINLSAKIRIPDAPNSESVADCIRKLV
ncbi:MAG: uroporphyrinogen-III synthase [Myxococcota bacterium]